ncbi:hypothetical protein SPFM12_00114 [Salmonella phage SPFM12]|nr:hypothetical protein SPFM12_00114 [Salmonella phage SPFM12]
MKIYGSGKETNKVYMTDMVKMYLTSVKILPANAYFRGAYDAGVLAPVYNSVYLVTPEFSAGLNTLWVHSGKAGDKSSTKPLVLKADQDNNEPGIAITFQTTSGHVISMKGEKFIIILDNTLGDLLGRMRVLNNDAMAELVTLMSTSGIQQKHVDMLGALPVLGKAVDATKAFGRTHDEMYQHHLIKNAHGYTCGDIDEAFAEVTDLIYQNGKQVFDEIVKALEDIRLGILERAHEHPPIISPIDPPKDLEEAILRDLVKTDMKDPRNCDWSELMK